MKLDRSHIKEVSIWYGRPSISFGPIGTLPGKHPESHITLSVLLFMSLKWDKNYNDRHLMRTFHVFDTVLRVLHTLSNFIFQLTYEIGISQTK